MNKLFHHALVGFGGLMTIVVVLVAIVVMGVFLMLFFTLLKEGKVKPRHWIAIVGLLMMMDATHFEVRTMGFAVFIGACCYMLGLSNR